MSCSFFFSLSSFCYHAYWFVNPWWTCSTWSHRRRVAFQFNQEPSWLPRYRHLTLSRFVSLCQITHESKTSSWLKDSDIIHKILEQATPFFPLSKYNTDASFILQKHNSLKNLKTIKGPYSLLLILVTAPNTHMLYSRNTNIKAEISSKIMTSFNERTIHTCL